jgi:hypothetical protein
MSLVICPAKLKSFTRRIRWQASVYESSGAAGRLKIGFGKSCCPMALVPTCRPSGRTTPGRKAP